MGPRANVSFHMVRVRICCIRIFSLKLVISLFFFIISDSPLKFPVDEKVKVMTPNQIYDAFQEESGKGRSFLSRKKFIVLGAGKTGIDCVVCEFDILLRLCVKSLLLVLMLFLSFS